MALHNLYRFLTFTIITWKNFPKPKSVSYILVFDFTCIYYFMHYILCVHVFVIFPGIFVISLCIYLLFSHEYLFSHVYLIFLNHRSSYTGLVHGSIPSANSSEYRRVSVPGKTWPRLDEIKKSLRSEKSNDCLQLLYGSAKHVYVLWGIVWVMAGRYFI